MPTNKTAARNVTSSILLGILILVTQVSASQLFALKRKIVNADGAHNPFVTISDFGAGFLIVGSLGYRYQPSDGGFHFRIVASPILAPITGFFFPSIGCSAGICY
jgi:hypothetical protein